MASGHVNRALTGRTHGCSDHCCTREENPCQPGAVHTWPIAMGDPFTANRRFRALRTWRHLPACDVARRTTAAADKYDSRTLFCASDLDEIRRHLLHPGHPF